jgi:hypothetical protein
MTDFDTATFDALIGRMVVAFRLKLRPPERAELSRTFFKLLAAHAIDDVVAAGKRCMEKHRTFPKPVDWLGELAPTTSAVCPPDRRTMRVDEADELARAAALAYEDAACACLLCRAADVTDRPLRFVPTAIGDDELERAFNPRRGVVELVGHWAHGEELARWYAARDAFYGQWRRAPRTLREAVAVIVGDREPGMEG